jgi:hypothetical protein
LPPASNMVGWRQQIKSKNAICSVYVRYKYCVKNFSRNTRGRDYMEDLGIDKHDNIKVCFKRLKTKGHYSNQFLSHSEALHFATCVGFVFMLCSE